MENEKKILVARSSLPEFEEYVEMIRPLWDSVWLTNMGENHEKLTEELVKYLQVPYVSLFTNGHLALELCIQAMGLTGEVITTPFTFVSTTQAIVRSGLTPVFADIDPKTYTIDPDRIEALITEKTSAIIPVHVYGNVCDVEKIDAIAKKHGLKVIYDAAHAFGVTYKGKGIGSFGDASMFSFHATKVFHTIEGGAVTTASKELVSDLYKRRDFGIKDEEVVDVIGPNAKMNEFQAVMGLCNLKHLQEELRKREIAVNRYRERLRNTKGLIISETQKDVSPNYAYFPLVVDEDKFGHTRDEIKDLLAEHEIYARKYFYPLTNKMDCYQGRYENADVPVAAWTADRVLTLPMSASLTVSDVDRICDLILSLNGSKS
ncbi:MAG: DegT/DnrJ/EryC1/StrS family aminotransferase [Lachnospiraceae bacterium]|nr:DegT/DnrJ/EryC1/StrS family aminotransferase [Lachnospiraceae bacterium]